MARDKANHHPYPRSARLNETLRQIISNELLRLAEFDDRIGFITVTGVETTLDVRAATVFLDSLDSETEEALEERRGQIQASVNSQTRMKRTPKLTFRADPAVAAGGAVEEAIRRAQHDDE
jgi:ribosome-binding factor A